MKDFSDPLGHALPFVKPSGQNILTQSDISNQLQLALSYFKVQQSCFMAIRANKNLEGGQQKRVRVLVLSNDVQVILVGISGPEFWKSGKKPEILDVYPELADSGD